MKIRFQNATLQKAFDRIAQRDTPPSADEVATLLKTAQAVDVSDLDRSSLNQALQRSNDAFSVGSKTSNDISAFVNQQSQKQSALGTSAHALRAQNDAQPQSWWASLPQPIISDEGQAPSLQTQKVLKLLSGQAEFREDTLRIKGEPALIDSDRMQAILGE